MENIEYILEEIMRLEHRLYKKLKLESLTVEYNDEGIDNGNHFLPTIDVSCSSDEAEYEDKNDIMRKLSNETLKVYPELKEAYSDIHEYIVVSFEVTDEFKAKYEKFNSSEFLRHYRICKE